MTLAELIARVRLEANDKAQPYFWSDEDITAWLNDAVSEAALRGRLIHESSDRSMCRINVQAGKAVYALHSAMFELSHVAFLAEGAAERCPVRLVSTEWLDANRPPWRDLSGTPQYAIQDDKTIRLAFTPDKAGTLVLEGFRLPREPMEGPEDEPEINAGHHRHLIHWALHRGFSIPDMESFDPVRSDKSEYEFTHYFGLRPDSDLRRITREDVPHHVEPFWP